MNLFFSASLDADTGSNPLKQIVNILLYLVRAVSTVGFVPSIVVGIVLLTKRLGNRRKLVRQVTNTTPPKITHYGY
jgi:hypothetical protein